MVAASPEQQFNIALVQVACELARQIVQVDIDVNSAHSGLNTSTFLQFSSDAKKSGQGVENFPPDYSRR